MCPSVQVACTTSNSQRNLKNTETCSIYKIICLRDLTTAQQTSRFLQHQNKHICNYTTGQKKLINNLTFHSQGDNNGGLAKVVSGEKLVVTIIGQLNVVNSETSSEGIFLRQDFNCISFTWLQLNSIFAPSNLQQKSY